ncbi:PREDICTED: protein PFC0760c-like [Papilio polytes]|uniref:protein PFC0760c-like n=1 Tax=Papilio polytes TaxID=76194 RepID=UPI0006763AE2|nr:PREDICTED: protein PFC0760c-like [Papilio polytes]
MGKKRKNQDNNSDSIDASKKKKSKTIEDGISNDVITSVNINNDTDVQCSISKKRKDKKAKKSIADDVIENVNEDRETGAQSNNKKKKVKILDDKITADVVEKQDNEISVVQVSSKKRKGKKIKDGLSKDNIKNVIEASESDVQSSINFKAKSNSGTPKKIIFVDDEPQEVTSNNETNKSKPFKKIKEYNSDLLKEEDVKDEDIDKFCDELGEDDNKQYENWVQLIEASLSSNKKKPK